MTNRTYQIKNTDDVFTAANNTVGIDNLIYLLNNNSLTTNSLLTASSINFDSSKKTSFIPNSLNITPSVPDTTIVFIGKEGQSIFDACMETYGTLDLLYKFITDNNNNNILSLNNENIALLPLKFDNSLTNNYTVYQSNLTKGVFYSTLAK